MNADFLQVFHHQLKYLMAVLEEKCVTGEEFHIDGMFGKFTTGAGFSKFFLEIYICTYLRTKKTGF